MQKIPETRSYEKQLLQWPRQGKAILAQFDEEGVIVYQAYNRKIGHFAAINGHFGGDFKLERMTWVKTNFLWMMYRSGWGTKADQEITLAIKVRRSAFEEMLTSAVPSSFDSSRYSSREEWQSAVKNSSVRLQWDPDHGPHGEKQERKAIQLGLRGNTVNKYVKDWILSISDVSEFVAKQREHVISDNLGLLRTPIESVYMPANSEVSRQLGILPS